MIFLDKHIAYMIIYPEIESLCQQIISIRWFYPNRSRRRFYIGSTRLSYDSYQFVDRFGLYKRLLWVSTCCFNYGSNQVPMDLLHIAHHNSPGSIKWAFSKPGRSFGPETKVRAGSIKMVPFAGSIEVTLNPKPKLGEEYT